LDLLTALVGGERRYDPLLSMQNLWSGLTYNGYPLYGLQQTLQGDRESIPNSFETYVDYAFKASGPVFACELVRLSVFSEARMMYRELIDGRPGDLFTTPSLNVMKNPWPGGTTGDLLSKALLHADIGGNNFTVRRGNRLKLLRPDKVQIVIGVDGTVDPDVDPVDDLDGQVIGYLYFPDGYYGKSDPIPLSAKEVAHFAPIPDPSATYRGMSWMTPVLREISGDKQATQHKNKFYQNGATPNMVITGQWTDPDQLKKWTALFRETHEGEANAYKSLVLGMGMDASVVGTDFQQLDYKNIQAAGETRIAAASGVGAVIAQLTEGMQGSSLNTGNYAAARRRVSDGLFRPLWRQFCGSYEQIITVPRNSELWYDDRDIAFLQEDMKDTADIQAVRAQSIRTLVDAGYKADSVVDAISNDDFKLLDHSNLFSVQLQPPGTNSPDQEPSDDQN